jgi:hypothetical protein
MKKKGLELSINFIIVLVLAVVTLFMGIIIFNLVFRAGIELEQEVSQSTKDQINRLLMAGDENVIMPEFFREMSVGEQKAFGLGIRNYGGTEKFTINIIFDLAVDSNNIDRTSQVIAGGGVGEWYFEKIDATVAANELEVISVPIRVRSNAKNDWVYVFNVEVRDSSNELYGSLQKIYVRVR